MKIVITGANGLLGQVLVNLLSQSHPSSIVHALGRGEKRIPELLSNHLYYHEIDLTDGIRVADLIATIRPDAIIHAAAMTQIDDCELNPIACWNINVTATRFLIQAAEEVGAFFSYISTDFVFDGETGPYIETDLPAPVNYYGSSKLAAEKAVQTSDLSWNIIRTVLVYGNSYDGTRSNIIRWVKNNLEAGKPIKVVNDQWRTPTYVEDLAKGIISAVIKNATGIYHISGAQMLTPYDMAIATAEYLHLDQSLIEKVTAATFTQPGKRPPKTGFIIDKAMQTLNYQPLSFKEGLIQMLG
ncbi:MAG: SDR family oxidoreductase [Ferruginibacter sp.]